MSVPEGREQAVPGLGGAKRGEHVVPGGCRGRGRGPGGGGGGGGHQPHPGLLLQRLPLPGGEHQLGAGLLEADQVADEAVPLVLLELEAATLLLLLLAALGRSRVSEGEGGWAGQQGGGGGRPRGGEQRRGGGGLAGGQQRGRGG